MAAFWGPEEGVVFLGKGSERLGNGGVVRDERVLIAQDS